MGLDIRKKVRNTYHFGLSSSLAKKRTPCKNQQVNLGSKRVFGECVI
jgi:hypothetical protein